MPEPIPPDLFSAAGVTLDAEPAPAKPKRRRKPRAPTPAERAAAARLEGDRRFRGPGSLDQRVRVGEARDLMPGRVVPFPLSRHPEVLSQTVQSLPHFYGDHFEKKWVTVGRRIEQRLLKRGIKPADALSSARELLEAALDIRATQAEREINKR